MRKILSITILVIILIMRQAPSLVLAHSTPATFAQSGFAFRDDDGTDSTATGFGAGDLAQFTSIDSSLNFTVGQAFRLRMSLNKNNTGDANLTTSPYLQYKAGGTVGSCTTDTWSTVPTTTGCDSGDAFCNATSTHFADGDTTSRRLTLLVDVGGDMIETNGLANAATFTTGSDTHSAEWEWMLDSDFAATNTTYTFRLADSLGAAYSSYTYCPTLNIPTPVTPDSFTGIAYADYAETTPLTGVSVCAVVNNGTPSCNTTDGSGVFTINTLFSSADDILTFFIDGGSTFGNTLVLADGGDIVTGDNLRIYQNHVHVRYETGFNFITADFLNYDNDQNSTDMLYDGETGSVTFESGVHFSVYTGDTVLLSSPTIFTTSGGGNVYLKDSTLVLRGTGNTIDGDIFNDSGYLELSGNTTINGGDIITSGTDASVDYVSTTPTITITNSGTIGGGTTPTIEFYNLTINGPNITTTVASTSIVRNILTIGGTGDANNDTLSISTGAIVDLPLLNSTVVLEGSGTDTITGAGILRISNDAISTVGVIDVDVHFKIFNNALNPVLTVPVRVYGGDVKIYSEDTATLNCALASGTYTFSGDLIIASSGTGLLTVDGSTNNPTVNIAGNLLSDTTPVTPPAFNPGSGTWTVSGNINLTNIAFSTTVGTFAMNGTSKTLTSSGKSFANLTIAGSVTPDDATSVQQAFLINSGSFAAGATNINAGTSTASQIGKIGVASGATLTQSSGGTTTLLSPDAGTTACIGSTGSTCAGTVGTITLGNLTVGNSSTTFTGHIAGTTPNVDITGNLSVTANATLTTNGTVDVEGNVSMVGTLDIDSADANALTIAGNFDNDGVLDAGTSTIVMDGTSGTKTIDADGIGTEAFYNLTFNDGGGTATYQLSTQIDVNNNLTITGGTFDANGNSIFIGGSWDNDDTFLSGTQTTAFDGSGAKTIDAEGTGTSSFSSIVFDNAGGSWSFTTAATVTGSFTITSATTVTAPSSTLSVAGNFNGGSTFTHNSGSVILNGAGASTQVMSGNTTFYTLTATASNLRTIQFTAGSTTTISANGNLTLTGTSCTELLELESTSASSTWTLTRNTGGSGTTSISYVSLQDSVATNALTADNSSSVSGNSNWTINGSCSPESSSANATNYSFQRKTIKDETNGVHWQFFYSGTDITIRYSSNDGLSWDEITALAYNTNDFSVWSENISSTEYVFLAVATSNDIIIRRGTLGSTSITWDTEANITPYNGTSASDTYAHPYISLDSSNYMWILARYYDGTNYLMKAIKSSTTANGTWSSTAFNSNNSLHANQTNSNVYGNIVPLASQDMYATFVTNTTLQGCRWVHSATAWRNSAGTACPTASDSIDSVPADLSKTISAVSDPSTSDVHLTYTQNVTTGAGGDGVPLVQSASYLETAETEIVLTSPAGLTGDLLVAFVVHDDYSDGDTSVMTAPSGWTKLYEFPSQPTDDSGGHIYWKTATTGDAESFTFGTLDVAEEIAGVIRRYRGHDTTTPLTSAVSTANLTAPTISATKDNSMLIYFAGSDDTGLVSNLTGAPTGMGNPGNVRWDASILTYDEAVNTGATGTRTPTHGTTPTAWSISLIVTPAGTGTVSYVGVGPRIHQTSQATFSSANTAGNLIVVGVAWNNNDAITSISDNAGNTYTLADGAGSSSNSYYIYYAQNITGHGTGLTVTVTWANSVDTRHIVVSEFEDIAASSALVDSGFFSNGTVTTHSTGEVTIPSDGEKYLMVSGVAATVTRIWTEGTNQTLITKHDRQLMQYQYNPTAGTINPTVTSDTGAGSRGTTAVFLMDESGDTTIQHAYKRWDNGTTTWDTNPVALDASITTSYANTSIETSTRDLYAFWIDTTNGTIYYRTCDVSSAASECSTSSDWAVETSWQVTNNVALTSNYSGTGEVYAMWSTSGGGGYFVGWDIITAAVATTFTQNDFEWYVAQDSVTLTNLWPDGNGSDLSENQVLTQLPASNRPLVTGDKIRVQLNLTIGGGTLTASNTAFKLQYSAGEDCTTASGWTDVGAKASGVIWRLYDETSLGDTVTQVNQISTSSSGAEGNYSEINPSSTNPNAVTVAQNTEWDWPVEHNGATENTSYCFRMVKSDGGVLDVYNSDSYPRLITAPGTDVQMRHGNFFQNDTEQGFFWTN